MTRLAMLLTCALLLVPAAQASADPARFAVVIGANRGLADEVTLQYAEQDASRLAKVLVQLSGVQEENLVLLLGSSRERVRAVLSDMGGRVKRLRAEQPDSHPLLLVYYSGHSSVGALHVGPAPLPFAELRELVQAAGADTAVFVIDGCRSGGLTRVKGGRHAPPFAITLENQLQSKGTAVLASSAEDEDAQESDRLGGGIFTTHVIGGLRGAADADGDRRVTLSEVYNYAYRETLLTTSRTRFVQHPTYAFRLEGQQDVTLTRTDRAPGQATLHLSDAGHYVVLDRSRAAGIAAEFQLERATDVLLPAGSYLVRHLGSRVVHEGRIDVAEGAQAAVNLASMTELPYGSGLRRGLSQESLVSLGVDLGASLPALEGLSTGLGGAVGAALDLPGARLGARLRYGWAEARNADVAMTQQTLGGDLSVTHIFDLPRVRAGLGVGVRVGVDRVLQDFQTRGVAPDRAMWVWRAAPVLRVEFAPLPRWLAGVECGLDVQALRIARGDSSRWESPVAPFCAVTGSMYLP